MPTSEFVKYAFCLKTFGATVENINMYICKCIYYIFHLNIVFNTHSFQLFTLLNISLFIYLYISNKYNNLDFNNFHISFVNFVI